MAICFRLAVVEPQFETLLFSTLGTFISTLYIFFGDFCLGLAGKENISLLFLAVCTPRYDLDLALKAAALTGRSKSQSGTTSSFNLRDHRRESVVSLTIVL